MSDRPKLKMAKGEGPFVGKVERKTEGGEGKDKWRSVILTAVTPWKDVVQVGEECVWFAPNDKVFNLCEQGQIVKVARPENAYTVTSVHQGEPIEVPAGQVSSATSGGDRLSGNDTRRTIAKAFDLAFDVASWWNKKCVVAAADAMGDPEDTDPSSKLVAKSFLGMQMDGRSTEALAVHILMGIKPKYTL
ncbi:MAG: hypothetical protein AMS18_00185 [Gemmatimonas sp. SG8_17]|nr:MAG: hypothetical protein AMS18_00185 [Gemmatimonas sp. SG8_17]